jgi:hypothetical protein
MEHLFFVFFIVIANAGAVSNCKKAWRYEFSSNLIGALWGVAVPLLLIYADVVLFAFVATHVTITIN